MPPDPTATLPAARPAPLDAPSAAPLTGHGRPLFSLRPGFLPRVFIREHVPLLSFLVLWGAFFVGGLVRIGLRTAGAAPAGIVPFVLAGAVFLVLAPVVVLGLERRARGRSYEFHRDRLEVHGGRRRPRVVPLAELSDVRLEQKPSQRRHGLGTIVLAVPARDRVPRGAGEIRIEDVTEPDEVCASLRALLTGGGDAPLPRNAA